MGIVATNMRIADPNSPGNAQPTKPAVSQTAARPREDAGTISVGSDRAELSGVADRLSALLQADSSSRAERIRQLTEAVANGTYHVDAAALSRALVNQAISAPGIEK